MRLVLAALLSAPLLVAQDPVPGPGTGDKPAPARTEAPAGGPAGKAQPKGQEPKGQEPKRQEPGRQDPKPADPPAGNGGTNGGTGGQGNGTGGQEPPSDAPRSNDPVPAGADPADLAAIRSAEAMIEAEKKLAKMIKEGKITGLDKIVTFDELESWPYEDALKGMPKRVRDLDGKKVLMTGFMLPIDEVQNIKEFLLVQSLWSCCYGQPPDINGIVRVIMPDDKRTDYFFDPLKIVGKFKVEACVIDGYCVDIYQLEAESLEPIR